MNDAAPEPAGETAPKPRGWARFAAASKPYGDIIDAVLKTLLIVGVFFGSYEYFSRQQAGRVEKSLAMVDEWQAAGHRDAWQRINASVYPAYAQNIGAIQSMAGEPEALALIYGNLGDSATGGDDDFSSAADRDVDQVFYFFERAALCANERICDYDVINTFLGEEARTFWLYFSRYADRRQAVGYAGYGAWTQRFAEGDIRRAMFGLI